jgi:hypothetical protein
MRWIREAATHAGGSFHLWFALMLVLSAVAVGVSLLPLSGLLLLVLGVFTVKLSQEIAVTSEHSPASLSQLGDMVRAAASVTIPELSRAAFLVVLVGGLAIARVLLAEHATPAPVAPPSDSLVDLLFNAPALQQAARLYTLGVLAAWNPAIGGMLVYPLQRMHGLSYDQANHLVRLGAFQNVKAVIILDFVIFGSGMLGLLFFPFLLPFLLVLGPAMSYVACREMFGPGGELHKKESVSALKPALET